MSYDYWGFRPYVSVAKRQANAKREVEKLRKKGQTITPVKPEGRKIATTFWGKAWCDNLESYSDFSNRLPRGRTYIRNGSVVDLQIEPGKVTALVSGSELYEIAIKIKPLESKLWQCIRGQCAGQIGSLVELLQGRLSKGVMDVVTRQDGGLFPRPSEIHLDCSCPDWADMCKHVAAVLYGVGTRLDQQPDLLFTLRKVDHLELIAAAGAPPVNVAATAAPTIASDDLADVFGIELDPLPEQKSVEQAPPARKEKKSPKRSRPGMTSKDKPLNRKPVEKDRPQRKSRQEPEAMRNKSSRKRKIKTA
jgi:uncharacterized Zn finger protein